MRLIQAAIVTVIFVSATGCVNQPRNYIPAGFESADEAREYVPNYLYFANKLPDEDWGAFYSRFPEYFKDLHLAKKLGNKMEFHPWYTAYAFNWTMVNRSRLWASETVDRLDQGLLAVGDDIFRVVYAKGVPSRVIWDNDFEILLYDADYGLVFTDGTFYREAACTSCAKGVRESVVLDKLGLIRPNYD